MSRAGRTSSHGPGNRGAARALPGHLTRGPRGDTQEATVTTTTPRPSGGAGRAHTGRGEALRGRGAPENRASRLDSQGLPRCAAASLSQDRQKSTRPALQAETAHGSLPSVQSHGAPGRALHQAEMTEKAVLGAALQPCRGWREAGGPSQRERAVCSACLRDAATPEPRAAEGGTRASLHPGGLALDVIFPFNPSPNPPVAHVKTETNQS